MSLPLPLTAGRWVRVSGPLGRGRPTGRGSAIVAAALLLLASSAVADLPVAPAAREPTPAPLEAADLIDREMQVERLLDALSPLGTGSGNAAEFFAALRPGAAGAADLSSALKRGREVDLGIDHGPALAPDDPLLLAASPWTLQARCAFFPAAVPFAGWDTWRVDEELALLFARSWVAEARATGDPEPARRAVRMGRLLLQDGAWVETNQAAHRAIVLGANELRRLAETGGRPTEAIAALRVVGSQQVSWLSGAHLADRLARELRGLSDRGSPAWFNVDVTSTEQLAALGGVYRLHAAAQAWPGASSRVEAVRSDWRSLTLSWRDAKGRERDDVLATAAAWCLEEAWRPDDPAYQPRQAESLGWGPVPGDDLERLLSNRAPQSLGALPALARAADAELVPTSGERPPVPSVFVDVSEELRRELHDRCTRQTISGFDAPQPVLPVDHPLVLEVETWLLSGGRLPVRGGERRDWALVEVEWMLWRSLLHRADRAWGTVDGARAVAALLGASDQLRERHFPLWYHWRLANGTARLRANHGLEEGRSDEALGDERFLQVLKLGMQWHLALLSSTNLLASRPVKRSVLGMGPPRVAIGDEEIDYLERFIGERPESDLRSGAAEGLWVVAHCGTFGQRRRAERLLVDLAGDRDPDVAEAAKRLLKADYTRGKKSWDVRLSELWDQALGD